MKQVYKLKHQIALKDLKDHWYLPGQSTKSNCDSFISSAIATADLPLFHRYMTSFDVYPTIKTHDDKNVKYAFFF